MSFQLAHFARRFRFLTLLRGSLLAGALYDAAFAAVMLIRPEIPASLLHLPLAPDFYLSILAVLLLMLAALYTFAARDTRRYSGIVPVAIAGRLAGGLLLLAAAWGHADLGGLYPLAAADLGFGLLHAAFWLPVRS
jgi:hypothetical protein